ncbi:hypothetical protein HFO42_22875 [Rhizobium leguminosarum]|uniref:Tetratricopeptide repeat protein n=1 Tax=Rhizobium leguminosarum TaxID=384 RepID=A0AAJ1ABU0_RHILE|nr:hypothetical protein [Rhizobium leguminosarum]MBY5533807.1 hypothetical protein [Rhizobium leguminosarum]MBY5594895.1 hypothetical protein [Rhizobium leguminosarum]MBY5630920.1 hypothetical protein [Rhizobium leguminosarum]MBY5652653.1 hypothetical protein [Rhizobium leguminosarum]
MKGASRRVADGRLEIDVELFLLESYFARKGGSSAEAEEAFSKAAIAMKNLHGQGTAALRAGRPGVTISIMMRAGVMLALLPSERQRALPAILCELATAFADVGVAQIAETLFAMVETHCPVGKEGFDQLTLIKSNRGHLKFKTGLFDEAAQLFDDSLAILEKLPSVPASELVGALVNAGGASICPEGQLRRGFILHAP